MSTKDCNQGNNMRTVGQYLQQLRVKKVAEQEKKKKVGKK